MKVNSEYNDNGTIEEIKKTLQDKNIVSINNFIKDPVFDFKNFKQENTPLSHNFEVAEDSIDFPNDFIEKLTQKKVKSLKAIKVSHRSYDLRKKRSDIDFIYIASRGWKKDWGGNICYVIEEKETLLLPIEFNTLTIIKNKRSSERFIQYVNHYAKENSLILILGELE